MNDKEIEQLANAIVEKYYEKSRIADRNGSFIAVLVCVVIFGLTVVVTLAIV